MKKLKIEVEAPVLRFLESLAGELDTTPERVAENLLVWCMAEARAEIEGIHGHVAQTAEIMWAFIGGDDGLLRGRELYDMIWQQHTEEERLAREALARAKAAAGDELTEWEADFMEKEKKRWERERGGMNAMAKVQKLKDSGKLPADIRGPSETILKWYKEVQDGELTMEEFEKRTAHYRNDRRDDSWEE